MPSGTEDSSESLSQQYLDGLIESVVGLRRFRPLPLLISQHVLDGEITSTTSVAVGRQFTFQCQVEISRDLAVLFCYADIKKPEEEEGEEEEAREAQNIHSTKRPASADIIPTQKKVRDLITASFSNEASSTISPMTTDEYIAKVYTKSLSRRGPKERKSKNIIPRKLSALRDGHGTNFEIGVCELDILQKFARATRRAKRGEVDVASIVNQVFEDHGLPVTSDESNKMRAARVEYMIGRIFEKESLLMTYVSGMTRRLKFTDYQILKAYRDYVCEMTRQDPNEFVDLMKWHTPNITQFANKISPSRIAREFARVLERESGLSDAVVTIDARSMKMNLQRSDLVALEKQYHAVKL
ncbi:hypothetical protein CRV24_000415 [Beauveria bassiana]|nr:hypothetical protein CRV24_000415 [Beauveria bassiana]